MTQRSSIRALNRLAIAHAHLLMAIEEASARGRLLAREGSSASSAANDQLARAFGAATDAIREVLSPFPIP